MFYRWAVGPSESRCPIAIIRARLRTGWLAPPPTIMGKVIVKAIRRSLIKSLEQSKAMIISAIIDLFEGQGAGRQQSRVIVLLMEETGAYFILVHKVKVCASSIAHHRT